VGGKHQEAEVVHRLTEGRTNVESGNWRWLYHNDWDGPADSVLEVTGAKEDTMELRALCSAKDPPTAWRLHCRLREELIAFIRDLEKGRYLPKHRLAWQPEDDRPAEP
jgi:hypothetical protein